MSTAVQFGPETLQGVLAGTLPLNTYVGLEKDHVDALAVYGFRLYEQGRARDAEKIFEGLIALDSGLYLGYAGMGALALSEEKLNEAERYLRRAAELNPTDATVHANLGETLLRQARFEEAAAEFETAMEQDPEEEDAGANRARAILDGIQIVVEEFERMGIAEA